MNDRCYVDPNLVMKIFIAYLIWLLHLCLDLPVNLGKKGVNPILQTSYREALIFLNEDRDIEGFRSEGPL